MTFTITVIVPYYVVTIGMLILFFVTVISRSPLYYSFIAISNMYHCIFYVHCNLMMHQGLPLGRSTIATKVIEGVKGRITIGPVNQPNPDELTGES